jgi:hypothetical protein
MFVEFIRVAQCFLDPLSDERVLAADAFDVDLEQYSDAVSGSRSDLGRRNAAAAPGAHAGMSQVVNAARERRGVFRGCQCRATGRSHTRR